MPHRSPGWGANRSRRRSCIGFTESFMGTAMPLSCTFVLGLILFLLIGFALLLLEPGVEAGFKWAAGTGLVALSAGILAFFLIQRLKLTSRTGGWFARLTARVGMTRFFDAVADFEDRLVDFYKHAPGRFVATVVLSFTNWALGALEVWIAFYLLGYPISMVEA